MERVDADVEKSTATHMRVEAVIPLRNAVEGERSQEVADCPHLPRGNQVGDPAHARVPHRPGRFDEFHTCRAGSIEGRAGVRGRKG